jgi:hypothetical protein
MAPAPPDLPRRSPTIYSSRDVMESSPGPLVLRYAIPLDYPAMYRWSLGNTDTADGESTITHSGGNLGNWLLVRHLGDLPDGTALADGNQTIHVSGGFHRTLPAATLTGNITITLGTTNAREGYPIELLRRDVGAYTVAIVNGGAGAGTLTTFPVSSRALFRGRFDGTNWVMRAAHTLI